MEVKKASLIVAFIVLVSTSYLALTILPVNVMASTLYVGGSGPGNYTKIQLAVDASSPGDTVFVYSGTYNEDVWVNKPLTLTGESRDTTVIRGTGFSDTVLLTADWVNISGFKTENAGSSSGMSAIRIFFVQNCNVTNNLVSHETYGISVWGSGFNTVKDNLVESNYHGIYVWQADNNLIQNNTGRYNRNGIYIEGPASHSNTIVDNNASFNENGIYVEGYNSSIFRISNNKFVSNEAGLFLESTNINTITDNTFLGNGYGIVLFNSSYSVLSNNAMTRNGIHMDGYSPEHWNTHVIDLSNTIDGEPVRFWKNATGGTVPLGTGEVILANCANVAVDNLNVSDGTTGILVGFSSFITITDNIASSNYAAGIFIQASDNVTIQANDVSSNHYLGISVKNSISNTISGNVVSWTSGHGFYSYNSSMTIVTQNSFHSNGKPADPFDRYSALHLGDSDDNMITDNSFLSNFDKAVSLTDSSMNIVSDNIFSNNGLSVLLLSSNSNALINNTLRDSTPYWGFVLKGSSHNHMIANSVTGLLGGIYFVESHDNTVSDNTISTYEARSSFGGIRISDSSRNSFSNNVMDGDGLILFGDLLDHWNTHIIDTSNTVKGRPIYYWKNVTGGTVPLGASEVILANCTGVVVQNQVLTNGSAGIELGFSRNNLIADNTLSKTKTGILLWNSDMNDVNGNAGSQDRYGIGVYNSNNNTVFGNDLWDNDGGIQLRTSDGNTVDANNVWNNHYYGISVDTLSSPGPGSRNNIITNNSVYHNEYYGIEIDDESNGNTVAYNIIVENGEGVTISDESDNNKVHHNNLINNTRQAYDDRSTNQWDDGYPSGGNYWSDYTGVDVFNGPNQDIPGSDFIGDTPYIIDFDSKDRYPLMSPFLTVPLVPSAPKNLQAVPGDMLVTLTWAIPSFEGSLPITNYRIYRGSAPGGEIFYAQIGNVLTYLDFGLTNGQIYCYRVSAVNGVGEGPMSNEACATPTTTPGAPAILQAHLSGFAMENVTVTWDLSSDDGAGQNSVVGYSILRGTTYDVFAAGYQPVAVVPSGTIEYNGNMTGEGDPNNYFYRICAVDLNNLTNCSSNQAGKFTRSLLNGPNLISIPLVQPDMNIETVLQTVKWDKAWTYDSSAQNWKSHTLFKPYKGELNEVNTSVGIWVNVMEQSNLTVAGIVPSTTSIYLHAGWNLVGFPSFNGTYAVSDLKASVGVESVEGFEALTPPYFLRALTDGDSLQAGYGYWIEAKSNTTWVVASS
jgi:parallel beta-helix repeat protein